MKILIIQIKTNTQMSARNIDFQSNSASDMCVFLLNIKNGALHKRTTNYICKNLVQKYKEKPSKNHSNSGKKN